jgi:hypothetical protein
MGCVFKYMEDLHHLEEELTAKRVDLEKIAGLRA